MNIIANIIMTQWLETGACDATPITTKICGVFFLITVGGLFSLKYQGLILMLCDFCVSLGFSFFFYILKNLVTLKIIQTTLPSYCQ